MRLIVLLATIVSGLMAANAMGDENWNKAWLYLVMWIVGILVLLATRKAAR